MQQLYPRPRSDTLTARLFLACSEAYWAAFLGLVSPRLGYATSHGKQGEDVAALD